MISLVIREDGKSLDSITDVPKDALDIVLKFDPTFLSHRTEENELYSQFTDISISDATDLQIQLAKAGFQSRFISLSDLVKENGEKAELKLYRDAYKKVMSNYAPALRELA